MIKKVLGDSFVYTLAPVVPQLLNIFMLPLLTPYLSPKDYALSGLLMAYSAAISATKDLGLNIVLTSSYVKYPNKYKIIWNKIFGILTVWNILIGLFIAGVVAGVLYRYNETRFLWPSILLIALPVMLFEPSLNISRKYYQMAQKPKVIVSVSIIASLLATASNYITIRIFHLGYIGWFISAFVITLFSFIVLSTTNRRLQFKPDFRISYTWLRRKLKIGLPILPHVYSIYLLDTSDRILLGMYNTDVRNIGLYSLAYSIGSYYSVLTNAIATGAGPYYYKLYNVRNADNERKARSITLLLLSLCLLGGVFCALWMKEFFYLFIKNDELVVGYGLAIIILMSYCSYPAYLGPVNLLHYAEKTTSFWRISFMSGIINVVLNVIFIPFVGIWASVGATFIALLYMAYSGYFLKEFKKISLIKYNVLYLILTSIGAAILVYMLRDIHIAYKAILSILIVCGGVYLYNKSDYKKLFS